ncbi:MULTISPECIES: UbiA family prenyltransferase [unclassified Pedobacter]|uniref:UbiA family prenyltransferase n=1 Tax=unclassified Pedobacter TaxID=2628915 RepID=UPI001E5AC558|nr:MULTISPECIES: UbiA family prenyltransferase [unclassified Pedobacter]
MKLLKFTRYNEWWEYKLIPILSVGYSTTLFYNLEVEETILFILKVLLAVIFGAVYVSIINDLADIKEDQIAGKKNRMATMSKLGRTLVVLLSLIIGIFFGYNIWPDTLSLIFFTLSYVVFSAYSLPPFRFKKSGFIGVLCDASGAHLFPSLLMSAHIPFAIGHKQNIFWMISIALWALFYGIRGILVHQFHDRENDLISKTTTYATSVNPLNFRKTEYFILGIEMIGTILILYNILNLYIALAVFAYILLTLGRYSILKYQTGLIIIPTNKPSQLLLNDLYLVFMPLAVLLSLSLHNKFGWLMLILHIILFPKNIWIVIKDFKLITKQIINNKLKA